MAFSDKPDSVGKEELNRHIKWRHMSDVSWFGWKGGDEDTAQRKRKPGNVVTVSGKDPSKRGDIHSIRLKTEK